MSGSPEVSARNSDPQYMEVTLEGVTYRIDVSPAIQTVRGFQNMDPLRKVAYAWMLAYLGQMDRHFLGSLFQTNLMEPSGRMKTRNILSQGIGEKLFDTGVAIELYLGTWKFPSVQEETRTAMNELASQLGPIFRLSAALMANTPYSQDKPVMAAIRMSQFILVRVYLIHRNQAGVTRLRDRQECLEGLLVEATRLNFACRAICDIRTQPSCMIDSLQG